eukprot:gene24614-33082_t
MAASMRIKRRQRKTSGGEVQTVDSNSGCIGSLHMYHVAKTHDITICPLLPIAKSTHSYTMTAASSSLGIGLKNKTSFAQQWIDAGFDENGRARLRWEIPVDHPGQDRQRCVNYAVAAGRQGYYPTFYNDNDTSSGLPLNSAQGFYVMYMERAAVHPTGHVFLRCGYFLGADGCETRRLNPAARWWAETAKRLKYDFFKPPEQYLRYELTSHCNYGNPKGVAMTPVSSNQSHQCLRYYEKVFVIAALWDHNYHHFLIDSLARIARALPFLLDHPDIMIYIRAYEHISVHHYSTVNASDPIQREAFISTAEAMRQRVFSLLGINSSRVISGFSGVETGTGTTTTTTTTTTVPSGEIVLAGRVYVPRPTRCAFSLSSADEVRLLARILLHNAYNKVGLRFHPHDAFAMASEKRSQKKQLIVLQRYTAVGVMRREWDNVTFSAVVHAFSAVFRDHLVVPIRSNDENFINFGAHGAGMTNMIFMPRNSLIVELTGEWDGRMLPVCGYHGPLCAACGHHHYIHHYDWDVNWISCKRCGEPKLRHRMCKNNMNICAMRDDEYEEYKQNQNQSSN